MSISRRKHEREAYDRSGNRQHHRIICT